MWFRSALVGALLAPSSLAIAQVAPPPDDAVELFGVMCVDPDDDLESSELSARWGLVPTTTFPSPSREWRGGGYDVVERDEDCTVAAPPTVPRAAVETRLVQRLDGWSAADVAEPGVRAWSKSSAVVEIREIDGRVRMLARTIRTPAQRAGVLFELCFEYGHRNFHDIPAVAAWFGLTQTEHFSAEDEYRDVVGIFAPPPEDRWPGLEAYYAFRGDVVEVEMAERIDRSASTYVRTCQMTFSGVLADLDLELVMDRGLPRSWRRIEPTDGTRRFAQATEVWGLRDVFRMADLEIAVGRDARGRATATLTTRHPL